jgi:hypothetical protein
LDFMAADLVSPQVPKSVAGVAVSTIAAAPLSAGKRLPRATS